jgi:ectoine hydroxylase-related dioxygenase (phytanoyl-CoA dioxygenase family)
MEAFPVNGWWWNPDEPGRGFFLQRRGEGLCVACCLYGEDGRPEWHAAGPLAGEGDHDALGESRRLALPGMPGRDAIPLHIHFEGPSSVRLRWGDVRIGLKPQHAQARRDSPLAGWWHSTPNGSTYGLVCEDLGGRVFGALLAPDEWLLMEVEQQGPDRYAGRWHRFTGGQSLGGAFRLPSGGDAGAATLTQAANEMRIVMPDGRERVFRRPAHLATTAATSPRPRAISVEFSPPSSRRPWSGLVHLGFEIDAGQPRPAQPLRLVLESDGKSLHAGDVRLDGWDAKVDLALQTHLLPNGKVPFTARLIKDGHQAWSRSFTLEVSNAGPLAEAVRASLSARNAPVVIEGAIDSAHFDFADSHLQPWFDREDAPAHIEALRREGRIDAAEATRLRQFVDEGYLVLEDAIEEPLLRRIDRELDDAVASRAQGYEHGSSQRLLNLHLQYPGVRELWRHPKVMRLLELIYGVPARPCQTLTYVFGSQQEAHQDTVHLTPFPAGYMCGVWVAVEDVRADSGELEVFPGTHRLPRIYMRDAHCAKVTGGDWAAFGEKVVKRYRRMLDEGAFGRFTYRPRRGTVLIWHENLLHGGSVRRDMSLSRRSIVSHYFADGAVAFYDSTGLAGNMD